MEIVDYLLARKKAGGGSDVTIEQLSVTENGTYSEQGIAYSPVVVNVPAPENSYQLKDLPTGTVSTIEDGTDLPMSSLKVGIEPVQAGSGDPSPENIRPISGWTEANVTRSGKNLFDKSGENSILNGYINSMGVFYTASSEKCVVILLNAGTYTVSKMITTRFIVATFDSLPTNGETGNVLSSNPNFTKYTFTITEDKWLVCFIYNNTGETATIEAVLDTVQVELGSTATTYEPYNGQTYTIQFKDGDNPLTVYGGTLDVTSGELVITHKLLYADGSFNVLSVSYDSSTQLYYVIVKSDLGAPANNPLPKSDKFKPYAAVGIGNCYITSYGDYLMAILPDQSADTVAKVTQWFEDNPTQFVYELAEPITYHLTPAQVRTLVGNNNIWADTGDVLSGKYFKEL